MRKHGLKGLAAFSLVIVLICAISPHVLGAEGEERIVQETSLTRALLRLAGRLPSVWGMKIKSGRVARSLELYEGELSTPDQDTIYSWIQGICQTPHRRPGTECGHQAERWVAEQMREIGLSDVTMDPVPITVWEAERWSLRAGSEEIDSFFVVNTAFSGPEGVEAPLVYVGEGKPKDFKDKDISGKIVVAEVPFPYLPTGLLLKGFGAAYLVSDPGGSLTMGAGQYLNFVRQNFIGEATAEEASANDVYWNSYKRGARAICLILRDQPSGSNSHYGPYDGIMKPMPGLWIGKHEGERLRELAKEGARATLMLDGEKREGVMHNVWGVLPGVSEEVILVTSHHDSPFKGAVEDGAGVAQVLAQAWTWSRVPRDERPKTLVFVADAGHFYGSLGGHEFARSHDDIMDRTRILITLEHLAAKEVEEAGREYKETGDLALTVMFTSHDPTVVGAVKRALQEEPAKATAVIPADFFGRAPTSDASGYVLVAGVPVISWIGCPYYLLDEHDTLDKVEKSELEPIAKTTSELIGIFMELD